METNGLGIRFTVLEDGKPVTFTLGVIERESWGRKETVHVFIEENGNRYADGSCYSGGRTGFGNETRYMKHFGDPENPAKIITTDPMEAITWMEQEEDRARAELEQVQQRRLDAQAEIDQLPKDYLFYTTEQEDFILRLIVPEISKNQKNKAYTEVIRKDKVHNTEGRLYFDTSMCYRKDGVLLKKKTLKQARYVLGHETEDIFTWLASLEATRKTIYSGINDILKKHNLPRF